MPPECTGPPTYYVIHAWAAPFHAMLAVLLHNLDDAKDSEVFVWLDIFSINQHPAGLNPQADVSVVKASRTEA